MKLKFLSDWFLLVGLFVAAEVGFASTVLAQNVDRISKREIERRQAALPRGAEVLARAQAAMHARNYAVAHEEFRSALELLPDAVTSGKAHDEALTGFCESGVKVAEQKIADGNFAEAESVLREVLQDRYDPNCRPALELLAHLQQPGYFNKTMGPTFIERVEEVKKLLADADGYYDSARYDLSFKKCGQVLALDPYKPAARRGEEKIDNAKYHYGEEAYNETRGRQLSDLQTGWQQPLRQYGRTASEIFNPASANLSDTARISNKLRGIRIEHLSYRNATVAEVIDDIRQRAPGVNIVVRFRPLGEIARVVAPVEAAPGPAETAAPAAGGSPEAGAPATPVPARPGVAPAAMSASPTSPEQAKITLEVDDIPLLDALHYIANQAALKVKVEPHAVLLIPLTEQSDELVTKTYKVPPEFFGGPLDVGYYLSAGVGGGGGQATSGTQTIQPAPVATGVVEKNAVNYQSRSGIGTGAGAASTSQAINTSTSTRQQLVNDRQVVGRADAKLYLQSMGVVFPPGSSATFSPHSGALVVHNTADNLDMVDALVEQASASGVKQVEIEAKFIEITQTNLKELGFDWLLGPFQLGNHSGVFGSGGTSGSAANPVDFPFVNNTGAPVGATQPGQPIGVNPVTAGNRSGTFGISANALDALLAGGTGGMSVAPGIFGLAGVFTDPQFQLVIRALNQKKGVDLLSAPIVATKSGQRAIIERG